MNEPAASFVAAAFDPLTHLPNRDLFNDRLSQVLALANRAGRHCAVHALDIDLFSRLVERTAAGDQALQIIAERFVAAVRDSDTVARVGWDEFAVLQPELEDEEDAADLAARLQRAMYAPILVEGENYQLGVTIGIAIFPADGADGAALMEAAEQALSRAKAEERGGVAFAQAVL
ncbi:MAG: GGDEF domain-containing protein [Candidatus Eremiobacteraeota bacterium]|nr:GGDEF domain-containing protein [Candidatus Eremiobacteraeota bacterium]